MPHKNSTNYQHPDEPNLLNLHKTMQYNNDGQPVIRTHVDGISLQGDVIVDKVKIVVDTLQNTADENHPVPVYYPSTPTVKLDSTTLTALETTTVNQGTGGSSAWKVDIGTNGSVTLGSGTNYVGMVRLTDGTNNLSFDQPNNDGEAGQYSLPVENYNYVYNGLTWDRMRGNTTDGVLTKVTNFPAFPTTIELGNTTLTALEHISVDNFPAFPTSIAVTQSTTPWKVNLATAAGDNNDASHPVYANVTNFPTFPTSITANQGTAGTSAWKVDIGTGGTVSLTAGTTVNISDNGGSITVDGTVSLSADSLTALEHISVDNFPTTYPITDNDGSITVDGSVTVIPSQAISDYYGEQYGIQITPIVQLNAYDGINLLNQEVYQGVSGNVNSDTGVFSVSCGTTPGSFGILRSRRILPLKAGQSNIARFLVKYDTPKASVRQVVGVQNLESGYSVGYNGLNFVFQHNRGGRAAIYNLVVNSYSLAQTVTLTLNSVAYIINIPAGLNTQQAAQVIAATFTSSSGWSASQVGTTVRLLSSTPGPLNGTFSISSSGNLSATLTQQVAGVAQTQQFTALTIPSWMNLTLYNKFQFKYSLSGCKLMVLNQDTGSFELLHSHINESEDAGALPAFSASFRVNAICYNLGGTNTCNLLVADMFGGMEGVERFTIYPHATSVTHTSLVQNTYHHILSIQNPWVANNRINLRTSRPRDLTVAVQSNDPVEFRIYINAPLSTGTLDFEPQNNFLCQDATNTGVVNITDQWPLVSLIVGTTGSAAQFDLTELELRLVPGSYLTVVAYSTAALQKVTAGMTWHND